MHVNFGVEMWNDWHDVSTETEQSYWRGDAEPYSSASSAMDADRAMQSTSKVPPYWAPALEHRGYPFRIWLTDVGMWSASTELAVELQAGAVAQRLGGVARNLVRQIPPHILRGGRNEVQPDGNVQHRTGLEVILRGLARRYGEADVEASIRAIVELLAFRRLPREPIDDALGRFEILKARAEELGDFAIGVGGLAWMLLTQLAVPKHMWPVLLFPNNGRLPSDAAAFAAMLEQIKTQCHMLEHTHAGPRTLEEGWHRPGETGHFWYEDASDDPFGVFREDDGAGYAGVGYSDPSEYWYRDDDDDSATEADPEEMTTAEELEYFGDFQGCTAEQLRGEYLFAKRRFRRFTGRAPRRFRGKGAPPRFGRRPEKGAGKKGKGMSSMGKIGGPSYMDVIGPSSLAGGKGKAGKRGAAKGGGNPRGADGQVMRCHECNSDQHLVRDCPHRRQKGKGNYAVYGSPAAEAALAGPMAGVMTGPSFLAIADAASEQAAAEADDLPYTVDMTSAPAEDGLMSWYADSDADTRTSSGRTGRQAWSDPVPSMPRTQATWFPWWREGAEGRAQTFLVRMQARDGEALLVDPGSPDNLVGDRWSARHERLCRDAGHHAAAYADIEPFTVGGVGRHAQVCRKRVRHPIALDGGESGTFEAPEIPDSDVPALLGLRALSEHRVLLDVANRRLYRVGPGGYKLQLSPGSTMNKLETATSGHLMLPCSEFDARRKGRPTVAFPSERQASD